MRVANQHDLDVQVEQIKWVIAIMKKNNVHAFFKTCNEILENGVEMYTDEEIFEVYQKHLLQEGELSW